MSQRTDLPQKLSDQQTSSAYPFDSSSSQVTACPACQGIGWDFDETNDTCLLCNGNGLL